MYPLTKTMTCHIIFFAMPIEKLRQLVRASYELVCYESWQDHPDKTFLTDNVG